MPRRQYVNGTVPRQRSPEWPAEEALAYEVPGSPPLPATRPRRTRRWRLIATAVVLVANLAVAAYLLDGLADADAEDGTSGVPAALPDQDRPSSQDEVASSGRAAPPDSSKAESPVLSLPGDFPTEGPGTFRFADGKGEVLGESGAVLRFRVAIEDGVDEDPTEVGEFVDEVLADEQGWTAGGEFRFRRVPKGAEHDFTIFLATQATTGELCAAEGLNVLAPSLPEGGVSCRTTGKVNLNLTRWRLSVPHYVDDQVPLAIYRQMLVNHEVGHQLGYGHESCPGDGVPASVMQQQTIFMDGCQANPWPYLDGERYLGVGAPVS